MPKKMRTEICSDSPRTMRTWAEALSEPPCPKARSADPFDEKVLHWGYEATRVSKSFRISCGTDWLVASSFPPLQPAKTESNTMQSAMGIYLMVQCISFA